MEDLSQTYHAIKELLHPKALKEKDLMSHDNPINLKAEKSYPIALDEVTFSFGAGAAMEVALFNDEDDSDDNAFIATGKDAPIVLNTATDAYLKYTTTVSAKANQQVTLAEIGFSLDLSAAGSAKALYYKKHPNNQLVRDAFAEDLKHFKTIFRFEDVENLEENDGLGFVANGSLTCNLNVSWSNIIATGISTLSSQLPLPVTLDISLAPSLTASFSVSVTDDFAYLLKKQANNQYLVSIRKASSTSVGATLAASIGVKFADPDTLGKQVGAICDKIIQSVLGNTITEINTAVQNFKQGKKSPIVEKLFTLFHLDKLPQPIDLLTPQLKQLEQDISGTITKLATESVSFSFSYQYNRIEEKKELLSVVIAGSDLKNYHGDLLRLKTGRLLDAIRNATIPFILISYLNEKVLTITKSWGLGLKVFDFTLLTSKDYAESKDTIQTDLKGTSSKVLLDRTKGYKWKLGKGSGSWMGEFSAAMPDLLPACTLDKFAFTWLFNTVLKDPGMGVNDLRTYLDSATLWGAVGAGETDRLVQKYGELKGKEVVVEGKLLFPDVVVRALLSSIAADGWGPANKKQLAKAMGAAMTYLPDYQLRSSPQVRQDAYAPLWASFLDDPNQEPADFASLAESEIQGMGDTDHLAEFEANRDNWIFGNSFAGVIRSNPGLLDSLKSFITGIADLQSKIQGQARYTEFDKSYNEIAGYLQYQFGLAVAGRFLLLWATDLHLTKDIKKVLTLSYGPDNNKTVVTCSVV
jgi:hypothetical protein